MANIIYNYYNNVLFLPFTITFSLSVKLSDIASESRTSKFDRCVVLENKAGLTTHDELLQFKAHVLLYYRCQEPDMPFHLAELGAASPCPAAAAGCLAKTVTRL